MRFLFVARGLTVGAPDREGTEEMETVRVSTAEAVEKVVRGEIVQASTCVLVLLAARAGEGGRPRP